MEILICAGEHNNLLYFKEIIHGSIKSIIGGNTDTEKSVETLGLQIEDIGP